MNRARAALALVVALGSGCAQLKTTSRVEIHPRPAARTLVIGSPASVIKARGATAEWTQDGETMRFEVSVTRECAVLHHEPVLRVETISKSSGGALYWEFGLGGLLLAGGLVGLIRPDLFGPRAIDSQGQATRDTAAGYRIGGILTGLSAVAIGAGVYDVLRTRDEVRTTEAFRPRVGEAAQCDEPDMPLTGRMVEIVVGEWSQRATPDDDGIAHFELPPPNAWPASIPRVVAEACVVPGVLRLGGRTALRFDFVVPYDAPAAKGHHGQLVVTPQPVRRTPPRPRATKR